MSITVSEIEKAGLIEAMRKRHFVATNSDWELRYVLPDGTVLCGDRDKNNMGHQGMSTCDELIAICNKHNVPFRYDSLGIGKMLNDIAGVQHIFVQGNICHLMVVGSNPPNVKQLQGLAKLYENMPLDERKRLMIENYSKAVQIEGSEVTLERLCKRAKKLG